MTMLDDMKTTAGSVVAAEADLDRRLTELLGKLATGDANDQDRRQIRELSTRRVRMMRPKIVTRFDSARKIAAF